MGSVIRWVLAGGMIGSVALASLASYKGLGTPRLTKQAASVRNQSLFGPMFMGRGFRGGK